MQILGFVAENYKKLRIVEITPKGRIVQITGKNGQGKTSVLDAIWSALVGAKAIPEKPVRKGADKARIKIDLGELIVRRDISTTGAHTLTVENAKGVKVQSPQKILDELLGTLSFDPLAFIGMKPKEQVEMLRQVAKIDIDIDFLNAENKTDYDARTIINREVDRLAAEVNTITVQDGLPKEKLDEKKVLEQMATAGIKNAEALSLSKKKQDLLEKVNDARRNLTNTETLISGYQANVKDLERKLENAKKQLEDAEVLKVDYNAAIEFAQKHYDDAPEGIIVDVSALTAELQQVQLTNREIDKRTRRQKVEDELRAKRRESDTLSRAIEDREEKKRTALQNAAMPVEGLTFDENQVMMNGIPIEQLGEAEQIRISTSIAMAANPKLRVLRVMHGEALDEDSLSILAEMAEKNDFQIWMAKVDSSGKVGIVMEDGMVKTEAETA
jgi:DNA repair exonuclease SbcCD ATPase subunit